MVDRLRVPRNPEPSPERLPARAASDPRHPGLRAFQDRGYEALLKTAGKRHDLIAVLLADPRELHLPDVGLLELEDAETGARVLVDSGSREVRRAYEQAGAQARAALSRLCSGAGIDLILITMGEDPARILMRFFLARDRG